MELSRAYKGFIFLLTVGLWLTASSTWAQTVRYVTDQLEVPLRAGASDKYKTLMMLPSGSLLHVLGTDSAYTRVRTADGKRGWIANELLMETPSARQRLQEAQSEQDNLQQQVYALTLEKNALDQECTGFRTEYQRLNQELAQVRKLAGGDLELDKQNQVLQQRLVQLEQELRILQQENSSLLQSSDKSLFLMGAGVLGGGLFLGLIFARLGGRKRERWSEL
ncbi:MAG: TIGR04211 family SH3 domain-containing protein [Candidatus Competibacteraceae bacterium]|nr:TIGR04211 family SH3 domain-containing protein [Candidatus Competibacteraceae bacterium]